MIQYLFRLVVVLGASFLDEIVQCLRHEHMMDSWFPTQLANFYCLRAYSTHPESWLLLLVPLFETMRWQFVRWSWANGHLREQYASSFSLMNNEKAFCGYMHLSEFFLYLKMAFTIYNVHYYYYCYYYKTCLQADEGKVHCAWKIPKIVWRKNRLHDTDPAKRYHCTDCCCSTMVLQFYYAADNSWRTFFNVFIYFPSLHVSSNPVFIIRRIEFYQYIIWYMSLW
jgi:hypothetical protein